MFIDKYPSSPKNMHNKRDPSLKKIILTPDMNRSQGYRLDIFSMIVERLNSYREQHAIPLFSIKQTIVSHLSSLNIKK